MLESER
jgi:hypothetical protein